MRLPGQSGPQDDRPDRALRAAHDDRNRHRASIGFPAPDATTTWAEYDHAYTGACSSADGANVLQISGNPGAPHLNALPDATWGLHLTDANIALGNLLHTVQRQIDTYFQPTPGWEGFVTNPASGCKARVQVPYLDQGQATAYTEVVLPEADRADDPLAPALRLPVR